MFVGLWPSEMEMRMVLSARKDVEGGGEAKCSRASGYGKDGGRGKPDRVPGGVETLLTHRLFERSLLLLGQVRGGEDIEHAHEERRIARFVPLDRHDDCVMESKDGKRGKWYVEEKKKKEQEEEDRDVSQDGGLCFGSWRSGRSSWSEGRK